VIFLQVNLEVPSCKIILDAIRDLDELTKKNWNQMQVIRLKEFLVHILSSESMFTQVERVGVSVEASLKDFLENITKFSASNFKNDLELIRNEMRLEEERQNQYRQNQSSFKRLSNFTVWTLKGISQVFDFMFHQMQINDYKLVLRKNERYDHAKSTSSIENVFSLWCLNSSIVFNHLSGQCRSVILTSGTLAPLSTFSGVMITFDNVGAGH
jgi:Rad3-related DNA helicase